MTTIENNMYSVYNTYRGKNMSKALRKNITIAQEDYDLISENAKKRHMSFSEFLCNSTLQRIKEDDEMDLFDFLDKYCEPVSKEEQEDIEKFLKDYDEKDDEFEEISVDDVLHDRI